MAVIPLKDGNVDKDLVQSSVYGSASADGIWFNLGGALNGLYFVELMILCNAVPSSEYLDRETIKSMLINSLDISYTLEQADDLLSAQAEDANEYAILNDNNDIKDYDLDSGITDVRTVTDGTHNYEMQTGTGITLEATYDYCTLKNDHAGIVRRAALFARPREVLTIPTRSRVGSYKNIQMGGQLFVLLARSTDWRDAKTTTKVLRVSLN